MTLLVTGQELADVLDLDYAPGDEPFDQLAEAARNIVGSIITSAALTAAPPACREAALSVAVEMYQARTSAGGQAVSVDFSAGPYRLSLWITKRVQALLAPYLDVKGMVG
jgi:hypothetical protein